MATSTETAQQWLESKQPSLDEVKSVLQRLEERIEKWNGDEEAIQGSIDAAVLLQSYVQAQQVSVIPPSKSELDIDVLIPDSQPIELEASVKKATFEALKTQLGNKLKL
ncbi:MAG: hypothetical protein P8X89_00340 [Reinekea sp.]|jgi:hypothetical protein